MCPLKAVVVVVECLPLVLGRVAALSSPLLAAVRVVLRLLPLLGRGAHHRLQQLELVLVKGRLLLYCV